MKGYLGLIPIYARVHKKQSKITRICIILAVFLVTAIFSLANMEIRSQYLKAISTDGNWHAMFKQLTNEQMDMIAAQPQVKAASRYDVLNYRLNEDYKLNGNQVVICAYDEDFSKLMSLTNIVEGKLFTDKNEAVLTLGAKTKLKVNVGDSVSLTLPNGKVKSFIISGFTNDVGMLMEKDAIGISVSMEAMEALRSDEDKGKVAYYVQLSSKCNIPKVISTIETQLGLKDGQVGRNEKLLGIMGMSKDSYILQLYGVAAVLAILVITAGILMITSNLNSNISRRTEFFGMMRCLGATKNQIKNFVRLEALNWCKTAVPIGILGGIVVTWILCNMLRLLSPGYFSSLPVFGLSLIGIVSGAVIGIGTVLLAASSPARRAAKVSPLTAVSGNTSQTESMRSGTKVGHLHIETALGIQHAMGSRKNFYLMTSSFAFSIILFLAFTTTVDFMGHALKPLKPYTPDLSIVSQDNTCSIKPEMMTQIKQNRNIKRAYGRMFAYQLPAYVNGRKLEVNLISYEDNQFQWAKNALTDGKIEDVVNKNAVLTVYDMNNPLKLDDKLQLTIEGNKQQLQIAGVLSECPFSRENGIETLICSENTFCKLTGEKGYTIIDIQLNKKASDDDVAAIRKIVGADMFFSDKRASNRDIKGGYYSMALFIYGFLVIIALISMFNIVNSIAMSVSARFGQYGAMRAIGMSDRQVIKMVITEASTYAICGILLGCVIGIPINKFLYENMITFRWGDVWKLPVRSMAIIILTVASATIIAVLGPAKRIHEITIVDTIHGE